MTESQFKQYRRKQIAELRPYHPGESMEGINISPPDKEAGSPKEGDMIARDPKNHGQYTNSSDNAVVVLERSLQRFASVPNTVNRTVGRAASSLRQPTYGVWPHLEGPNPLHRKSSISKRHSPISR
jgi:hypothetical protein